MQPAPEPIKADVEKLLALAHHGASNGDSATFTSEDLQTADRNIDQYMLRTCGYGQISITATDDAYQGIPATIGSGAVGLTLNNRGREAHQVLIVRIDDGVTEPFSTLLDLPPDQRMQTAAALGSIEVDPGQVGTLFLRLAPGRYGVGDFLSQGSTSLDAPGSRDPHYLLGLHGEFTVARSPPERPVPAGRRVRWTLSRWTLSSMDAEFDGRPGSRNIRTRSRFCGGQRPAAAGPSYRQPGCCRSAGKW